MTNEHNNFEQIQTWLARGSDLPEPLKLEDLQLGYNLFCTASSAALSTSSTSSAAAATTAAAAVILAVALLQRYSRSGHSACPVQKLTEDLNKIFDLNFKFNSADLIKQLEELNLVLPDPDDLNLSRPLIFDSSSGLLYIARYYYAETIISNRLNQLWKLQSPSVQALDPDQLNQLIFDKFPTSEASSQREAAQMAFQRRLLVISGGPGTGKTTTIARIIQLLTSVDSNLKIAICAPTGKAAARINESLKAELGDQQLLTAEASTIHRLLGARRDGTSFTYDRANPLPFDLVVVDEASMIDLQLMAALIDALPDNQRSRLILAGDSHQLSSVETGRVFADICQGPAINLSYNFRFGGASPIARLSESIRRGDFRAVINLLSEFKFNSGQLSPVDQPLSWTEAVSEPDLTKLLTDRVREQFVKIQLTGDLETAFDQLSRLRILCPTRSGPQGIAEVNRIIAKLTGARIDDLSRPQPGTPVMATSNDYRLGVFNGDIALAWSTPVEYFFPRPEAAGFKRVYPSLLTGLEPAWCLTVHKSQGSEFEKVILILPERMSPLLTREIFYTAVTRARKFVEIWGRADIIKQMTQQRTTRYSNLIRQRQTDSGQLD